MADQFRTEITADPAQFNAAMNAMQAHLGSLGGAFAKFQSLVVGVGAAISAGGMFGAAVEQSKDMVVESEKLGRALGISATEASVLAVALGDIHQNADVMLNANRAITRSLRENEEAFKGLGVATREENGAFRNSLDIMLAVNKRLAEFKEGTDRNIEGQKIYKKAWEEVAPVLKLTADLMEQSKAKAEALRLVVGAENVAAVTAYRAAMNDVGDVMQAVGKAIGDAVMPILTDLGNWFASTGPDRVDIMRGAMAVLVAGFYSLSTIIQVTWEFIKMFVQLGTVALLKFAEVAQKALELDFSGAKEAWARGGDQQVDIMRQTGERVKAIAEENGRKTADAFERGFGTPVVTATQRVGGTGSAGGDEKGRVQMWDAKLKAERDGYERMKLEQGSFESFSKEKESAYWKTILDTENLSKEERVAVSSKYYDVEKEIRKRAFDVEVAVLKAHMDSEQATAEERINLANRVATMTAKAYGRESKEYIAALSEMQKKTDEWSKQQIQLRDLVIQHDRGFQLSRVELERDNLETMERLGQIKTKDKLARLKELKDIEYQIELKALQQKLELLGQDPSTNPVLYQEQLERIAGLKLKHAADMNAIDNQMKIESVKIWNEIGDAITGAFSTAVKGVIMGTQSIGQAFRNMGQSVLLALADMAVKAVAEAIKNAIIGRALAKAKGVSEITSNAAVAASAAAASVAAIPVYGWALAPEVAATTFADTIAWTGALASAFSGFDVPVGVNPMTQLHQEEMVLPADIANPLRESLAEGRGAAGSGETHLHFHGPVWNHQLFGRYLVGVMRDQHRLFNSPGK